MTDTLSTFLPSRWLRWVPVGVWGLGLWLATSLAIGLLIGSLIALSLVLNGGQFDAWFIQTSIIYAGAVGLAAYASRSLAAGTSDPRRRWLSYGLLIMAVLGAVLVATVIAIVLRPGIVMTRPIPFFGLASAHAALGLVVCLGVIAWEALQRALDRALAELREKQAIEREMQLARDVQRGLLPERPPPIDSLDVAFICQPAQMVGGDTLDFLDLPDQRIGFTIGDVVGKGIAAALMMANVQAMVRALAPRQPDPANLNTILSEAIEAGAGGKFVTFAYVIFDPGTGSIRYSLAGHHPPIIVGPNGTRVLDVGGLPLGISAGVAYETGHDRLDPGERMVLYTDGVVEAPPADDSDDEFGRTRLIEVLRRDHEEPSATLLETTLAYLRDYTGDRPLADDTTMVMVRRCLQGVGG